MTPEEYWRLKRVFLLARDCADPQARAKLIEDELAPDDPVLPRVLELLEIDGGAPGDLDVPALGPDFRLPEPDRVEGLPRHDHVGWVLGNHLLEEVLGRGGIGVVYRAQQFQPRRSVAVKVLRTLDADLAALERFRAEADLLGRMQHPGIAQVFEAGMADTPVGRQPFLVMEYVDGGGLLDHARNLGFGQRVELLRQVTEAVHHAHGRGVLHGDLKPSNVLVDGEGRPKVVDFGLARVMGGGEARAGGTPPYLAPELDAGTSPDRRSEVYALGVIARELIAGRAPAGSRRDLAAILERATAADRSRRYGEVAELHDDLVNLAAGRPVRARRGGWTYRAGKALSRHRWAAGAAGLSALGAGLLTVAMSSGDAGKVPSPALDRVQDSLLIWLEAARTPGADPIDALAADLDGLFAESPLAEAFARGVVADRDRLRGSLSSAHDQAARAVNLLRREVGLEHPATLDARRRLGQVLLAMGRNGEAERELTAALDGARRLDPEEAPGTALTLATLFARDGRFREAEKLHAEVMAHGEESWHAVSARAELAELEFDRADGTSLERLQRQALETCVRLFGPAAPQTVAETNDLAVALLRGSDGGAEALQLLLDTLGRTEHYGPKSPLRLQLRHNLASAYTSLGRHADAVGELEEVWRLRSEVLGPQHRATLRSLHNLASDLDALEDVARAGECFEALLQGCPPTDDLLRGIALTSYGSFLARRHRDLPLAQATLVQARAALDRSEEAYIVRRWRLRAAAEHASVLGKAGLVSEQISLLNEVATQRDGILGPRHPETLTARHNLGTALTQRGELEQAVCVLEEVARGRGEVLGLDHPARLRTLNNLATALEDLGRLERAESVLREVVERSGDGAEAALALGSLARCLSARGRDEGAVAAGREAVIRELERGGATSPSALGKLGILGQVLCHAGAHEEALIVRHQVVGGRREVLGDQHAETLKAQHNLAVEHEHRGDDAAAGALWKRTWEARSQTLGAGHRATLATQNNYGWFLEHTQGPEAAVEVYRDLVRRSLGSLGRDHWYTATFRRNLGRCLMALERYDDARVELEASTRELSRRFGQGDRRTRQSLAALRELERRVGSPGAAGRAGAERTGG